jgi:hypothetical protein
LSTGERAMLQELLHKVARARRAAVQRPLKKSHITSLADSA